MKGLDLYGRLRLDQNNGVPLPYSVLPAEVIAHLNDFANPHKVPSTISFGYLDTITASEETIEEYARTVDGVGNEYGHRMIRDGKVTGIAFVYMCEGLTGQSEITLIVLKNGLATEVSIGGVIPTIGNGLGGYSRTNSYFKAGDTIGVKISLYNDAGSCSVSNFTIDLEIEIESRDGL